MLQYLARGFSRSLERSLEWVLLAVVCGSTLWLMLLALGLKAPGT
jgi:hypothetical protein